MRYEEPWMPKWAGRHESTGCTRAGWNMVVRAGRVHLWLGPILDGAQN